MGWFSVFTYMFRNHTSEYYLYLAQYSKETQFQLDLHIHHMFEKHSRIPMFSTEQLKQNSTHGKNTSGAMGEKESLHSFQL